MVGSEGVDSEVRSRGASGATRILTSILQTSYVGHAITLSWALGLLSVLGWKIALGWFIAASIASAIRKGFERREKNDQDRQTSLIVAVITTFVWAAAPVMAWYSGHPLGQAIAVALFSAFYVLVFAQLRRSPRRGFIISTPLGLAGVLVLASLWGGPLFWPLLSVAPFTAASLFVMVSMTMYREEKIGSFQKHQARLIEELQAARDRADAANEAKSSFLGVISHELRTPMNGVLGAAQLLSATPLEQTQRDYLSIIRNSGDGLLSLLNDILDMTKIEAGKMTFEAVEMPMDDLHKRVTGPFLAQAEAKGIDFVCTYTGEAPAVVRGDPLRVGQVIQNLLSNAVKFTERGTVEYAVHSSRLTGGRVRFEFSITDSGAGISPEDLSRLFQPFTQVDASSTRRFGGTGLGLTIARRMANIMGGDIKVKSTVGTGSTFTFEVEVEVVEWNAVAMAEPIDAEVHEAGPLNVLVVEDHPVNRMILEAWLNSAGHSTSSAENGQIAVDMAADHTFDLIIMDVNMPVMDGLTATRLIREKGANSQTVIAVLSASARTEDHEAGLEAGADTYLTKPIDFTLLAKLMNSMSEVRSSVRDDNADHTAPESGGTAAAA